MGQGAVSCRVHETAESSIAGRPIRRARGNRVHLLRRDRRFRRHIRPHFSSERRRFPIERPAVAMLGGALMLVLGILTPAEAIAAINLDVILLLVGMMVLVSGLDACGFFDLVSSRIAARAKTQTSFLVWLMVTTAALSAVVLNDTIALLVTPVVVRSARALRVNPIPYLVAVAISLNVGSVATEVGNPQNAFLGIRSGIPF